MVRLALMPAGATLALLALVGCGSGGGTATTTPADLSPAAKAKWDEYCAHGAACLSPAGCPSSTCMARVAEEGTLTKFADCQVAKPCDSSEDECAAGAGTTTDAERTDFTARCLARFTAPESVACFGDPSICTRVVDPLIRSEFMHAVDACLTVRCEDRLACVDAAIEPLNCF
jgi:hypothetical protein